MKTQAHSTPQDRLAGLFSKFAPFLRGRSIDMSSYTERIQSTGVAALIEEFVADCEAKDITLPPGYWRALFRLKEEAER
jgi:hypothetical protein